MHFPERLLLTGHPVHAILAILDTRHAGVFLGKAKNIFNIIKIQFNAIFRGKAGFF
jgi:hypothetical protein